MQQGVWNMPCESLPLACGYLKAFANDDPAIAAETDIRIFSFDGGDSTLTMIQRMLTDEIPDVIGFSVLGWNFTRFGAVAETFKQVNPDGWVVFGGNHVTNQAPRVMGMFPWVDVIVNGEGELTFRELLQAYLAGTSKHDLCEVLGLTYQLPGGAQKTTEARPRIRDLDVIPSPILTGAIPMTNDSGAYRYDVGIMETNRGCPYKCAFCYWGGAIGQKVRAFSIDRLREEVELYGKLGVVNIALCDANFGMLPQDSEFVDLLIKTREKYGFPRNFDSSWAKNKGVVFRSIVKRMKKTGFTSSFTLALQTLDEPALSLMGRKNMKVNEWEELAGWLKAEGMETYAELIWGCPGQTYDSFIEGYDRLAAYVSRIATYPHLLMPNTDYTHNRESFGFVTHRGEKDDFQYVLAHNTMTVQDNRKMHRFLFWARLIGEYMVFRNLWTPLRKLAGITQGQVMLSLDSWLDAQSSDDHVVEGLKACRADVCDHLDLSRVTRAIHFCYVEDKVWHVFNEWWNQAMLPRTPDELRPFFADLFRYDWFSRPVYDGGRAKQGHTRARQGRELATVVEDLPMTEIDGEHYYVRGPFSFVYDIPAIVAELRAGTESESPRRTPMDVTLYMKAGFWKFLDNHEFYPQYVGRTAKELSERAETQSGRIAHLSRLDDTAISGKSG